MKFFRLKFPFSLLAVFFIGCTHTISDNTRPLSKNFKEYWYSNKAEITSYKLNQSRYGEQREGSVALIFVTEDFLTDSQVKANKKGNNTTPVLKLNVVKKFITGIYPYSVMQSTFLPLETESHALKISFSSQEWCGQIYAQLNNRQQYEITSHSYFQGEADETNTLPKAWLENEFWTMLRVNPESLPTGELDIIPSLEYLKLHHKEVKSYKALAEFYEDENLSVYKISYPTLKRSLKIYYHREFPYKIEKWQETFSKNGKEYTTTATKTAEIRTDYWNKNSNKDLPLRQQLKLNNQ